VTASVRGVSATIRVVVVPEFTPPGFVAQSGTPAPDTLLGAAYTAPDTITITASGLLEFTDTSDVVFGTGPGYILSLTPTEIKAMARSGHRGRASVTNVAFTGNAETGVIILEELRTDSVDVARARFKGNVSVSGGIVMTVTAPAGMTFTTSGSDTSRVFFGTTAATTLDRQAATLTVSATADYTGGVKVTNVNLGSVRLDSLTTPAAYSITRATFPGTIATGGALLDTIVVTATGGAALDAATSTLMLGADEAFVVSRTATQLKAFARRTGYNGTGVVTDVTVGGITFPSLETVDPIDVTNTTTNEANEPGNDSRPTATPIAFTGASDTIVVVGAGDEATDLTDYYILTLSADATITGEITWHGDGAAGFPAYGTDPDNPDLDLLICPSAGTCGYGDDLAANAAAGLNQPEVFNGLALTAGTYWVRVLAFVTPGPITYRLRIFRE
jgi:hypothetical protein